MVFGLRKNQGQGQDQDHLKRKQLRIRKKEENLKTLGIQKDNI
jgi:hypothetical protein